MRKLQTKVLFLSIVFLFGVFAFAFNVSATSIMKEVFWHSFEQYEVGTTIENYQGSFPFGMSIVSGSQLSVYGGSLEQAWSGTKAFGFVDKKQKYTSTLRLDDIMDFVNNPNVRVFEIRFASYSYSLYCVQNSSIKIFGQSTTNGDIFEFYQPFINTSLNWSWYNTQFLTSVNNPDFLHNHWTEVKLLFNKDGFEGQGSVHFAYRQSYELFYDENWIDVDTFQLANPWADDVKISFSLTASPENRLSTILLDTIQAYVPSGGGGGGVSIPSPSFIRGLSFDKRIYDSVSDTYDLDLAISYSNFFPYPYLKTALFPIVDGVPNYDDAIFDNYVAFPNSKGILDSLGLSSRQVVSFDDLSPARYGVSVFFADNNDDDWSGLLGSGRSWSFDLPTGGLPDYTYVPGGSHYAATSTDELELALFHETLLSGMPNFIQDGVNSLVSTFQSFVDDVLAVVFSVFPFNILGQIIDISQSVQDYVATSTYPSLVVSVDNDVVEDFSVDLFPIESIMTDEYDSVDFSAYISVFRDLVSAVILVIFFLAVYYRSHSFIKSLSTMES